MQVLITGSVWDSSQNAKMEVIKANEKTYVCKSSSYKYPNDVAWVSGGFVENKIIICGGWYVNDDDPTNVTCYSFGGENKWQLHSSPKNNVVHGSAVIPLSNGLWIIGGVSWDPTNYLSSTEIVHLDGTRTKGVELPLQIMYQCGVKHSGVAFLIGGI